MPGNEFGDRLHNFFGQENLRQGQYQLQQAAEGNWSRLSEDSWVGNQRQTGFPFISNLKNHNAYQSEDSIDKHGNQPLHMPPGLNFTQSNPRPEFSRNVSQNQQPSLNGYAQGRQNLQTRQNEGNFFEADTKFDRINFTSRGLSTHEAQHINGPELQQDLARSEGADSLVSFDFFGGQQQLNSGNLSMMQSLPRQQSAIPDMQLLQQQAMLSQIQELQRQQQLEQLEARRHSPMLSSIAKQGSGNHSTAMLNGVPVNEVPNHTWQPELMESNRNWLHHGASPLMQGPSSGFMLPYEQNQAPRSMSSMPQQADQSLCGVPVSTTARSPTPFPQAEMNKPALQKLSIGSNSSPANQYTGFPHQFSQQDPSTLRHDFQGKNMIGLTSSQGHKVGLNSGNLQQVNSQPRNQPMQGLHGRQELAVSSEMLEEKTMMQVAPSQNSATLDPTEEKILYGLDDNLWDAFGRTTTMSSGGNNMLDGSDFYSGLPSLQSGTWSALMQSALAETSSDDVGLQEEWNGLSFQNAESLIVNQQLASFSDSGKMQPIWVDSSNTQTAATPKSRSSSISVDVNRPKSSFTGNASILQQPDLKSNLEPKVRTESSKKFTQFPEGGSPRLGQGFPQKPVPGGSHTSGNIDHPSGVEMIANNLSGSWTGQQRISPYNSDDRQQMPNGWNIVNSLSNDRGDNQKNHGNRHSVHMPQVDDHKRAMQDELAHTAVLSMSDSVPNSSVGFPRAKPAIGSPKVSNESLNVNNDVAIHNSSTAGAIEESRKQHSSSHNLAFWGDVDSSMNSRGNSFPERPQILESRNSDHHKGMSEMHETVNSDKNNESDNSFHAHMSHHTSSALQQNNLSDASDASMFLVSKQKSAVSAGRKPSVTRKFQYHPMGNLEVDVEPAHGTKRLTQWQDTAQQQSQRFEGHDQGGVGQPKSGLIDGHHMEVEKGNNKGSGDIHSRRMNPGFAPLMAVANDKSVSNDTLHKNPPSSHNMLELFQKVDQPSQCSSLSAEMSKAETSDGSGRIQQNQSSASQGFSLQLAPPSQKLSIPDTASSSHSSFETVRNLSHPTRELGQKGHLWLNSAASVQSHPATSEPSQGDFRNNVSGPSGHQGNRASQFNSEGSFSADFASNFSQTRSHPQNQHNTTWQSVSISLDRLGIQSRELNDSSGKVETSQSASMPDISVSAAHINLASSAEMSQLRGSNIYGARNQVQQVQESDSSPVVQQPSFPKSSPNVWASVTSHQCLIDPQPSKPSPMFKSHLQLENSLERSFSGPRNLNDQDTKKLRSGPAGASSMNPQSFDGSDQMVKEQPEQHLPGENRETFQQKLSASQGKQLVGSHPSNASNPASIAKDIEAFGRSLKPNNNWNQHYSFPHQMQASKTSESTPHIGSEKTMIDPDCVVRHQRIPAEGAQQILYGNKVSEVSVSHTTNSSGDPRILHLSSNGGDTLHSNLSCQDSSAFGQNSSQNISTSYIGSSVRGEHSQVSPLMAPSWFDQFGTFKSGNILAAYDRQKDATVVNPSFPAGKPPGSLSAENSAQQANISVDGSQLSNVEPHSALPLKPHENFSSSHLLPPVVIDESLVVITSKKRKSSTSELLPWHKELAQGSQRVQSISVAEIEWARAANQLIERMEDEAQEDGPVVFRPKKRLIRTTQIMQQLLTPPPAAVLSTDACSHYENVAYEVSRLALRDACNIVSCSGSDTTFLPDSVNLLSETHKTSAKSGDLNFPKVMEDFVGRARKLENDFLRVDKRASILDLRMELQDLEKFSVINRFAMFHTRALADGGESTASLNTTATPQRLCLQRYVTQPPVPMNLSDRVQCLSL